MKYKLNNPLYLLVFIVISCNSESSTEGNSPTVSGFIINAFPNSEAVSVDEEFNVSISSEENITGILYSFDNFVTEDGLYSDFGASTTLKFNFDQIGSSTIYFKAVNQDYLSSNIVAVPITVNKGTAVKITGLQLISFSGIDTSWDPEFPATNPNHLADVLFSFDKSKLQNPFGDMTGYYEWFTSSVKQNQGDLTWVFEFENLYIKPEKTIRMGLVDEDVPPLGQDLMGGLPDYRDFNLNDYAVTKPASITIAYPEINLEFIITVEWPN